MVWQNLNLFPWRSVIDNVAFGLEMRGVPRAQRYERAETLIASVGLARLRAAICRANCRAACASAWRWRAR